MQSEIRKDLYVNNGFLIVLSFGAAFVLGLNFALGAPEGLVQMLLYFGIGVYGILNFINIYSSVTFLMMLWAMVGAGLTVFALFKFVKDFSDVLHVCDEYSCNGLQPEMFYLSMFLGAMVLVTLFVNFIKLWQIISMSF